MMEIENTDQPLYPRIAVFAGATSGEFMFCQSCGERNALCPDCDTEVCVYCDAECPECKGSMF